MSRGLDPLARAILTAVEARSWDGIADAQLALVRADPDRSPSVALEEALAAGTDADRAWFDRTAGRAAFNVRSAPAG